MNWTTIKNRIYDWVTLEGDTAIWLNGNGPQPTSSYYGMQIISSASEGWDYKSQTLNVSNERTYVGNRDITLNLHYYGIDAFMKVDDKVNSLETQIVQEFLREDNIVYVDKGNTTDGPILYDSDYKEHALNSITLRAANVIIDTSDYYDSVVIDGTIKEDDTIKQTVNINVSI